MNVIELKRMSRKKKKEEPVLEVDVMPVKRTRIHESQEMGSEEPEDSQKKRKTKKGEASTSKARRP